MLCCLLVLTAGSLLSLLFPSVVLLDLNVGEIEKLTSQQRELEGYITTLEESVKKFRDEERSLMNQAADLRKQWVGCGQFTI